VNLKDFQDRFQRAILEGDDAILDDIPNGARETNVNLLGIYRDAYALRLIDVIGNDHEMLRAYVGEERFRVIARGYIAGYPSGHPNARWFAQRLPEFLKATEPYRGEPELYELAALERQLNDAFDGPDAPALSMADLAAQPPQAWAALSFRAHPTAVSIEARTNVAAIWSALKAAQPPPETDRARVACKILVWRQETTARFRELGPEEAMLWAEMCQGAPFGQLCEMLAVYDAPETAPARAAGYLKGWLDQGLLTSLG
jgi:hypothetical protein